MAITVSGTNPTQVTVGSSTNTANSLFPTNAATGTMQPPPSAAKNAPNNSPNRVGAGEIDIANVGRRTVAGAEDRDVAWRDCKRPAIDAVKYDAIRLGDRKPIKGIEDNLVSMGNSAIAKQGVQ